MDKLDKIKLLNSLRHGDITTLLESDLPEIDFYVNKIVPEGMITTIWGPSQQFKSTYSLYLALCIASNRKTFNFGLNKRDNILWIDEEMGVIGLKHKIQQLQKGLNITNEELNEHFKYMSMMNIKLDTEKGLNMVKAYCLRYNIGIIFIDSVSKVIEGDENSTQAVSKFLHDLRMLSEQLGVAWVIIHHTGKSDGYNGLNKMRGSIEFGTQSDFSFQMYTIGDRVVLKPEKHRHISKPIETINFSVTGNENEMVLEYIGLAKDEVRKAKLNKKLKIRNGIIDYIIANPKTEYKVKQIIEDLNLPDTIAREVIYKDKDSLHHQGIISYNGYGKLKFLDQKEDQKTD